MNFRLATCLAMDEAFEILKIILLRFQSVNGKVCAFESCRWISGPRHAMI